MARIVLEQMFPRYAPVISELRQEGVADEDILSAIVQNNRELERQGYTKQEVEDFYMAKSEQPPRPGLGRRALESIGREASFGFYQPDLPEAEGIPEGLADLVGTLLGFAVPAGAAKVVAGRTAVPLLSRLIPKVTAAGRTGELLTLGRSAATKGIPEALAFTGLTEGATAARTGELPSVSELGEHALINSVLFSLGEGLRDVRAFNAAEIKAALPPRTPGEPSPGLDLAREPTFRAPGEVPVEDILRGTAEAPAASGGLPPRESFEFLPGQQIQRGFAAPDAFEGTVRGPEFDITPRGGEAEVSGLPARRGTLEGPSFTRPAEGAIRRPGRVGPQTAIPEESAVLEARRQSRVKQMKEKAARQVESVKKAYSKYGYGNIVEEYLNDSGALEAAEQALKVERRARAKVEGDAKGTADRAAYFSEVSEMKKTFASAEQASWTGELGPKTGPVRFTVSDVSEMRTMSQLHEAAARVDFKVKSEPHRLGTAYYVEGKIDGKLQRFYFGNPLEGLDFFVRRDPYGPPALRTRAEVIEELVSARRSSDLRKAHEPTGETESFKCSSPCKPAPERGDMLNESQAEEMYAKLFADSEVSRQWKSAHDSQVSEPGLAAGFSRFKQGLKQVPVLQKFFSPSFTLETDPVGAQLIAIVDDAMLRGGQWLSEADARIYGKPGKFGKRVGGLDEIKISKHTPESIETGYALENRDIAVGGKVGRARKILADAWEWMFNEAREKRPDLPLRHVKDYLYRIFPKREMLREWDAEIEALMKDGSQASVARASQLREAKAAFSQGNGVLYENIPRTLRAPMFETRTGQGHYSFDAVKAVEVYASVMERKIFREPVAKQAVELIDRLPEYKQAVAREYVRDFLGVKDKIPGLENSILNYVREFQFIRTFGANPALPVKNAFQGTFTLTKYGPKWSYRGLQAALTEQGRAIFEESGHPAQIPGMFLEKRHGLQSKWKRAVDAAGFLFNKVEYGLRIHAYMTGLSKWFGTEGAKRGLNFARALEKGYKFIPEEARFAADKAVRDTQFRYGKADLPFMLRGPVAGTAFQFSSFSIKAFEFMWKLAVREGPSGRMKLAALFALGSGAATIGGALGFPTIGEGIVAPLNMVEMVNLLSSLSQGEVDKAKAAMIKLPAVDTFLPALGPAGQATIDALDLARRVGEGEATKKMVARFGERNVLPVFVTRMMQAAEQWDAGGSAVDFVRVLSGLPNQTELIRREALRLIENGEVEKYRDFLRAVAANNNGVLPKNLVNPRKVAELRRQHRLEQGKTRREQRHETIFQKGRRRLRGRAEQLIRSPIYRPQGLI